MHNISDANNPLVSVIIPCHNYGKYLEQCVTSVTKQSYSNLEIVIIDDGSTDDTRDVAKRLAKTDDRIRFLSQPNKGITSVRNQALKEAKGQYMIQLDADDYIDTHYVEKTLGHAMKTGCDIVYTNFKCFGDSNTVSNFPEFDLEELKNQNYIHVSSLCKINSIRGFEFDKNLSHKSHEDWDFFLGLCLEGRKAELCKSTYLHYRIHSSGRNNLNQSTKDKVDYAIVYNYIIDKYSKKYPEKLDFLSGLMLSRWLIDQYKIDKKVISGLHSENKLLSDRLDKITSNFVFRLMHKVYSIKNVFK